MHIHGDFPIIVQLQLLTRHHRQKSFISFAGLPGNIVQAVLQASDIFVAMMRRQTTLTHIAQATR